MSYNKKDLSLPQLLQSLPPIIARKNIDKLLGGIISRGYLANLDSQGLGPRKVRIGRNVGYLREDLVAWLEERLSID